MIFNYYLLADFDKAGRFPSSCTGLALGSMGDTGGLCGGSSGARARGDSGDRRPLHPDLGGRRRLGTLPRYLAQSRALLASLGRHYLVVARTTSRV